MALHTLTPDGHMGWRCVDCGTENQVHASHQDVQVHLRPGAPELRRTVRLPGCQQCGSYVLLKVDFTEAELAAPNMLNRDGSPTLSRHVAGRHMQLIKHLETLGKSKGPVT
jgi:DNA-directed RNA polymerase subunit RPC12/RpoP